MPTYSDYRVTNITSSRVKKALKEFAPEIVHVHTPFSVGWLGLRYARRFKTPVIGTYHTLIPEFLMYIPIPLVKDTRIAKRAAWKFTNFFYNKCDVITTPSLSMKMELEKNGSKKVVVLSNAIDFDAFSRARKKTSKTKKLRLIYFGRISFEKNIEVVIFALKHLLWKDKNVSLTITGSGPALKFLKELVKEEKLSKHVEFHKPLSHDDLPRHVAGHDVFVTASTIETQGLTILESMACGLPCVGADFLAIPDSIEDGKNGLLFKPFDFLRKKTGKNAVESARKYSLEHVATETEKLYAKTTAKHRKNPG